MKKKATSLRSLIVTLVVSLGVFPAAEKLKAVGFLLPNQDPDAIARGDAFAATADNPSAIYYNPAGITQLEGCNLRVGLYAISPSTQYHSNGGVAAHTDADFMAVPQIYFVDSLTNYPVAFGLGIYSPYGLALDWGAGNPFQDVAQHGSLLYTTLNPIIAWRVCSTLSIAVGPTINYSRAEFNQSLTPYPFAPFPQFKFDGDGWGYGMTAGILWQPHPMVSFGLNYRLATTVDYSGNIYVEPGLPSTGAKSSINFPQNIVGGISFRPTPNWNFEFDLNWADWHIDKQINFQDPTLAGLIGPIPGLRLNMNSSFIYDFGVTRQLGHGFYASVGYIFSENSSPDANFSPLIPDMDLHLGSIGIGHHGERWDWSIAYHFAYGTRNVQNDSYASADGKYETFNNAINIAGTFKF